MKYINFQLLGDAPLIRGCEVVALFINADGFRVGIHGPDPKAPFTGEDIWNSSKNGELFGILCAMRYLEKTLNKKEVQDFLPDKLKSTIKGIIDTGEVPKIDLDALGPAWFSGIGKECAQIL